jgi:hypothetical protein
MFVLFTVHGACAFQASYLRSGVQVCGRSQETYALPLACRDEAKLEITEFSGRRTERVWARTDVNLQITFRLWHQIQCVNTPDPRPVTRDERYNNWTRHDRTYFISTERSPLEAWTSRDLATFKNSQMRWNRGLHIQHGFIGLAGPSRQYHWPGVIGSAYQSFGKVVIGPGSASVIASLACEGPPVLGPHHTSACESHHP